MLLIRNRKIRFTLILLTAVVLGLLTVGARHASALSFTQDTGNTVINGCCTGPYVDVTVTLNTSTSASISFQSLSNGGKTYLTFDGSAAGVNVNASSFSVSNLAWTNLPSFTPGPFTIQNPPGTSNVNGFGLPFLIRQAVRLRNPAALISTSQSAILSNPDSAVGSVRVVFSSRLELANPASRFI